jgi:hypothetical protein
LSRFLSPAVSPTSQDDCKIRAVHDAITIDIRWAKWTVTPTDQHPHNVIDIDPTIRVDISRTFAFVRNIISVQIARKSTVAIAEI